MCCGPPPRPHLCCHVIGSYRSAKDSSSSSSPSSSSSTTPAHETRFRLYQPIRARCAAAYKPSAAAFPLTVTELTDLRLWAPATVKMAARVRHLYVFIFLTPLEKSLRFPAGLMMRKKHAGWKMSSAAVPRVLCAWMSQDFTVYDPLTMLRVSGTDYIITP